LSGRPTECRYCRYPAPIRDVAMATTFWLSIGYNFGCMIASDTMLILGVVFGFKLSDEDIADFEVIRQVAMATIFGFLYMGCTLAPPGEYNRTVRVWRRCGLVSNYFDLVIIRPHRSTTYVDAAYCYRPSSVVCRSVCRSVRLSH